MREQKENNESCKCEIVENWQATLTVENVFKAMAEHTNINFVLNMLKFVHNIQFSMEFYTSLVKYIGYESQQG